MNSMYGHRIYVAVSVDTHLAYSTVLETDETPVKQRVNHGRPHSFLGGCRDRNPGHVRWDRQADPRMLDTTHPGILFGSSMTNRMMWRSPSRPVRARGPSAWMQIVDLSPGALLETSHRTPPGLALHHRGPAQETRA